jgi:hypothetical protein
VWSSIVAGALPGETKAIAKRKHAPDFLVLVDEFYEVEEEVGGDLEAGGA